MSNVAPVRSVCWKSRSTTRCLADGIEVARRFVGQQQGRLRQHGAADGDALFLPLRKAVGKITEPMLDAGFPRELLRAARDLRRQPQRGIQAVGQKNILKHVEVADELEALKNQPDLRNAKRAAGRVAKCADFAVLHANRSSRRGQNAGDQMQQRGFP